jgi:hypothetical protein
VIDFGLAEKNALGRKVEVSEEATARLTSAGFDDGLA